MVLETHKLCVTEPIFLKILKYLIISFYWINSIMKNDIISCVPAQISYLGKFLFLRYGPQCSQSIQLPDFLVNHISKTNQWKSLILCMWIQIQINQKLIKKVLGTHGQKLVHSVWLWDSKIDCILRMNWWNELIFWMLVQI